jgi:hypothetical protein
MVVRFKESVRVRIWGKELSNFRKAWSQCRIRPSFVAPAKRLRFGPPESGPYVQSG